MKIKAPGPLPTRQRRLHHARPGECLVEDHHKIQKGIANGWLRVRLPSLAAKIRAAAKRGDSAQAIQFIRRARSIDPNKIQFIYNEAQVQALANHPAQALKALRGAFEKGYSPEEARNDPGVEKP
jgi:hypothetical protein